MVVSHKNVAQMMLITLLISTFSLTTSTHARAPKKNLQEKTVNVSKMAYNAGKLYLIKVLIQEAIPKALRDSLGEEGSGVFSIEGIQAFSFCAGTIALIESIYKSYADEYQKNKDIQLKAEIEQRYAELLAQQSLTKNCRYT
ncbi:MAG: hypothetical protein NT124_02950 [Candidatus Dependentiae bacterium]|nr:hypothetical protein [Candidatus Dependentiae bacterium]